MSSEIYVRGMHGLGDCIHQRGVLRQLVERYGTVYLETSWPAVYHDMPAVRCVARGTTLRTQLKNAARQARMFVNPPPRRPARAHRVWYTPDDVRRTGSVLGAMCAATKTELASADFRMPVPAEWIDEARIMLGPVRKPVLIYRPLVERSEWGGCAARNPEAQSYVALVASLLDQYHVVSLADLVPGKEWMVSPDVPADTRWHRGELRFEALVGLFALAALVWASPGFAVPLSQALGTPVICVFGGYESGRSFSAGARFAPYLPIDTITPCECFSHHHNCGKTIDMERARARIAEFVERNPTRELACV